MHGSIQFFTGEIALHRKIRLFLHTLEKIERNVKLIEVFMFPHPWSQWSSPSAQFWTEP